MQWKNIICLFQEYAKVGAIIKEDLDESPLIIGVKTPPVDLMMPEKTYVFFSHTIKAQESNMPLLDVILERVRINLRKSKNEQLNYSFD